MGTRQEEDFKEFVDKVKQKLPSGRRLTTIVVGIMALMFLSSLKGRVYYDLGQNEILFVKAIGTGTVHIHKDAGWKWVRFGEPTVVKKSFTFWFSSKPDQGSKEDQSIKARFNDNGHGKISGSIRIDAPLEDKALMEIYSKYKTQEAIEHEIIRTTLEKAVYFAGPLMSSTESASTKRNMLLSYIEDQAQYGIYKTTSKDVVVKDEVTGAEKTITQVDISKDEKAPNGYGRHEESLLARFGFKSSNLSINEITYDDAVEAQIKTQRDSIMAVQVAIANAKKAEQDAITAAKNGEANAATAKWAQEVIKAQKVTEAEQVRDVAKLTKDAAEFTKQKNILDGQGEAEKRRLVMEADGALSQKLETYEKVMGRFAQEFGKQKWVPEVMMGSASGDANGSQQVAGMMNLLSIQALESLGLNLKIPAGKTALPEKK